MYPNMAMASSFFPSPLIPCLILLLACSSLPSPSLSSNHSSALMNPIDGCWRSDPHWASNRRKLVDCALGFGRGTLGGKLGRTYTVTDASDDAVDPKPGTLRYGAIQTEPLWITFADDMVIRLENELMVNSFKTIDGRGASVEVAYGPCITVQGVVHVIIHGISVHDCTPGKPGLVRSSPVHVGHRLGSDGDAITVLASEYVWVDHCRLSRCYDGLVDVTHASTAVTVSNNYFSNHDKVMLFGHRDTFVADKAMKVTVVFNYFGEGLVQRMPRYDQWEMYAIGGSADPTIFSQGNYFNAPSNPYLKQVTKRETKGDWKNWKWRSSNDHFLDGAYFVQSGWGSVVPAYTPAQAFSAAEGWMVPSLTADAGPLRCVPGRPCTP